MKKILVIVLGVPFLTGANHKTLRSGYNKISEGPSSYILDGVFIGGEATKPASLLKVKLLKTRKGVKRQRERVYFQLADAEGRIGASQSTYSHIIVESKPPRVVIDFANVRKTAFGPKEIRKELLKSNLVKDSNITMDPIDHSTTITLNLVSPRKVSAFYDKKRPGRLYLEIQKEDVK